VQEWTLAVGQVVDSLISTPRPEESQVERDRPPRVTAVGGSPKQGINHQSSDKTVPGKISGRDNFVGKFLSSRNVATFSLPEIKRPACACGSLTFGIRRVAKVPPPKILPGEIILVHKLPLLDNGC